MRAYLLSLLAACTQAPLARAPAPSASPASPAAPASPYPPAPPGPVVEVHHGVRVPDPYRWLEDMGAPAVRDWVRAENALTDRFFAGVGGQDALRARLAELSSFEQNRVPRVRGGRYFWIRRDPKEEQPVLWTARALDAAPTRLFDPSALPKEAGLAFVGFAVSENGARVAYGLAAGGGDWQTWRLRDVPAGQEPAKDPPKDLKDELPHVKYYPPALSPDGKLVYYSRFPAPPPGKELTETDHDCKLYLHRVGADPATDTVLFERPDQPTWQFEPEITRDGRYLLITIGDGQVGDRGQEQIAYLDLARPGARPVTLVGAFEAEYVFVGNDGPVFYFQTTLGAPRKRIVALDVRGAGQDKAQGKPRWREIVPEGPEAIQGASMAGGRLFVTTLKDARAAVAAYDLKGRKLGDVALPGLGTVRGFDGAPGDKQTFYYFTSFTTPGTVYRYDIASGKSEAWRTPHVPFDADAIETTQVFFPSKDGTRVPMFLTGKKGLPRDGKRPTLITAYGFGGMSMTPYFDPGMLPWLEHGGVLGLVNVRGGGEYGEAWHQAAMRTKRQVGMDDFLSAGEWLVKEGYTSTAHLGAFGASGGGMLVAAVTVQRPDLFGASVPLVGVHDLLRFQLFGQGAGWQGDMGSPDDPAEFKALYAISPLHNVRKGTRYPAMLLVTSDHDVRVAPLHSYKLAAALQAAQAGPAPILLRVYTSSGHGGGAARSQRIEQQAELLGFFAHTLGLPL